MFNRKIVLGSVVAGVIAASAFAAAHSPITQRQEAMKAVGGQMRTLGGMAQGKTEYDDFAAISAFEIMRDAAATAQPLFASAGDGSEDTRALPEIWAEGSDFDARMTKMIADLDTALAAEPADLASFAPLFGAVAGNCKGCHEKYRAPEE